jgi:hypothetical protein
MEKNGGLKEGSSRLMKVILDVPLEVLRKPTKNLSDYRRYRAGTQTPKPLNTNPEPYSNTNLWCSKLNCTEHVQPFCFHVFIIY